MGGSRGARKAAQNKATKAAHAAKTKKYYDDLGGGKKVTYGDIAKAAAGAIPFVGGALAAKDLASGIANVGTTGIAGDVIEGAGSAGAKLGKAVGVAGTAAGIVGAGAAAYDTAQLYNKKSFQDKSPEEQEAFRNRKSGRNASRQRDLGNETPLTRQSPLKQASVRFDPNLGSGNRQTQNYATLSQRVGSSVDQAIGENRARAARDAEEERKNQAQELNTLRLADLKRSRQEELIVSGDTSVPSANQYLQKASTTLVNQQGDLVKSLNKGDITTDEFATQSALLTQQVGGLKATKETLTKFQEKYQGLLDNKNVSDADNGQSGVVWDAMRNGDLDFVMGDDGQMRVQNGDGTLDLPLSQINRLPDPTPKAPQLDLLLKGPTDGLTNELDPKKRGEAIRGVLDKQLSGDEQSARKTLLAFGVDRLGLSLEEAQELYGQEDFEDEYGNSNALEAHIENAFVEESESQWKANHFQREQNRLKLAKEEITIKKTQQAINQSNESIVVSQEQRAQTAQQTDAKEQTRKANQQFVQNLDFKQDPAKLIGTLRNSGITNILFTKKQGWIVTDPENPEKAQQVLGKDPNALQTYLGKSLKTNTSFAPLQRQSPFKRLTDWVSGLTNK